MTSRTGHPARLPGVDVTATIGQLRALHAHTVSIGSPRDPGARAVAAAVARAWAHHGEVLTVLDWPEVAASWLRHARRFTVPRPDAWVVVLGRGPRGALGWTGMAQRLRADTGWDPERTVYA